MSLDSCQSFSMVNGTETIAGPQDDDTYRLYGYFSINLHSKECEKAYHC